ncbi:UDP-galactose transporter senju [Phlebotomus argentipes]|uniref:UDP-galactose transporter senju n=1 Tax=Phlebotomus argentipes TaxID=94469 RepID=UPI00289343E2|nr:UDP-galactose transporter senju [Phlebotomus argentipes]
MLGPNFSKLFPSRSSAVIFMSYIALFVNQGILVTASQGEDNKYSFNTVTVVLLTELLKLIVSACLYCKDHSFKSLWSELRAGSKVVVLYFVPAFLYCLYNNLAFVNLSRFDPTTYYLLLQFRVVITGILFQIIFKKYLSRRQWLSLLLLTLGCMVKQVNFSKDEASEGVANAKNTSGFDFSINAVFILTQTLCSCLAGVYNEYLLKREDTNVNIYVQNVIMYVDSIVCNVSVLLFQGDLVGAFQMDSLRAVFRLNVIVIMVNNAAIGIVTSFFLKYMNSIIKTFASALELFFTAILCYILFAIPIYLNTILAIGVVSFAVFMYSQNPVVNLPATTKSPHAVSEDTEKLLMAEEGQVKDQS